MLINLIFLIVAVVMVIGGAGVAWAGLGDSRGNGSHGGMVLGGIVVALLGIGVFLFSTGFKEIDAGQVGIVTKFGQVEDGTLAPGLAWRMPFVESITTMDTRVQNYNFGSDDTDHNGQADGIEAFTSENQPAYLFGVVNYHIDPQYASLLFQTVGPDYFDKIIHQQADAEIKLDARRYTVDQITAKRDELAAGAEQRLVTDVAPYHILIDGVFVSQVSLSADYLAVVEEKQAALQKVETAKANAETARQNAQGVADSNVITAKGQAQANAAITSSLTPELIQYTAIQRLNPNVQVIYLPEGQNFLFNLQGQQSNVPAAGQ